MTVRHRCHRPYLWNFVKFLVILVNLPSTILSELIPDLGPYQYLGCYSVRTDLLKDSVYARSAQTCIELCENSNIRYAILSGEKCFCDNIAIESEKFDTKLCNVRCSDTKSQYCGGVDAHSYYSTNIEGPPDNLRISNTTENSILITWDPPNKEDKVSELIIKGTVVHSFTSYPFFPQPEFIVQSTEDRFEMTDLHPATKYNITVSAICGKYVCGSHNLTSTTEVGSPDPIPEEPKIMNRTDSEIVVNINPYKNNNGPVTSYLVIVQKLDSSLTQPFDEELLGSYERAQEDGTLYYIAGELEYQNTTQVFAVGDNQTYGGYWNAPINKDAHIHISLGVVSTLNGITKMRYAIASHEQHEPTKFQYADFEPGQESVLALTIICIVFAVFLALSIVIFFYLKHETARLERLPSDTHELTLQGPMENDGFVGDGGRKGTFKEQLNALVENVDNTQRLPRNAIRMNIDDIIADGRFGEVITGKLYTSTEAHDCQVHIISDDMNQETQSQFLKDFENIIRLMPHEKFLHFYGITASVDWFYLIFENNQKTLKSRLIESRIPLANQSTTFCTLSEEFILQWIYEIAMAMEYLEVNKVAHKHLCSYSVYVTNMNKIKVSLFGPITYAEESKKVDISRWLAPEVLRFQHYSTKSDIWSFACLAWECCTLGATPYANITSQDLLPRIKNGLRPEQPPFVYSDLYQLFLNCWQLEPSDRPDFEDVAFNVRQVLTSPTHALSFRRDDRVALPYFLPLLEMHN
ncbi:putative inactive tyrosine-protein kinase Wsck isoform X2 [Eupeodes corollae]|uniref:putative inactive tyrosine-protein kinase Wsck isoform X2 n=1 Tax=Eupeodes corollae TaxID=290404 RepID=UPI0024920665|nr:putative inactive tyrosine-protein kinase Wsck isoform X2 [Eupeodes corollae]